MTEFQSNILVNYPFKVCSAITNLMETSQEVFNSCRALAKKGIFQSCGTRVNCISYPKGGDHRGSVQGELDL